MVSRPKLAGNCIYTLYQSPPQAKVYSPNREDEATLQALAPRVAISFGIESLILMCSFS